jgi:penicillin amidase
MDMTRWHWGKIHRLHLNHALGRLPIFKPLLGIGPMAATGDGTTINLGFYRHSNPYAQTVGASLRFFCDMGTHSSRFILPSGQSGHPFSPHYRDQTALWRCGNTIDLGPSIDEKRDLERVLLLTPL